MARNDEYIEFDLKTLCFYVLRRWKPIVGLGLVMALLLGALMAYSEHNTSVNQDAGNSYWVDYQQYKNQVNYYKESMALTQSKIDSLEEYMKESVLMSMDYRNVYRTKVVYYIDTGYQVLPENTYQDTDKTGTLSWYYRRHITEYSVYEELSALMGIDTKYVMELVSVSIPSDSAVYITACHSTEEGAVRIADLLQKKMEEAQAQLNTAVEEHKLTLMEDSCGVYIDETLKENQKETAEEVLKLKNSLNKDNEAMLELIKESNPGELNVVTAFIKGAIAGGAIGVVLVVAYLLLKVFISNRVIGAFQLTAAYQAPIFGEVIYSKEKLSGVEKKINALEDCLTENSEANIQYIAENIKNQCGEAKTVMVCSDLDDSVAARFVAEIAACLPEVQLLPAGNVLKDANALRTLAACDAALLIAQRDQSKNAVIGKMVSQIKTYQKRLMGFVVSY